MNDDDFRTFVLGLPETKEGQHAWLLTFLVRGRRFATLGWPDPHKIAVALSLEEQDLLLTTCPLVVERVALGPARTHPSRPRGGRQSHSVQRYHQGMPQIRATPFG